MTELVGRLARRQRCGATDSGSISFDASALRSLARHDWRGNVRELANLVERISIMHPGCVISVHELPPKFQHIESGDELPPQLAATDQTLAPTDGAEPILVSEPAAARARGAAFVADGPAAASVLSPMAGVLPVNGIDLKGYLTDLEKRLIEQALEDTDSVVARAADRLQIRRTTLVEKMRKYGLGRLESRA